MFSWTTELTFKKVRWLKDFVSSVKFGEKLSIIGKLGYEVFSCRTYLQYGTVIALHTCVISWTLNLMLKSMKKTRLINNDCSFSRDWK